MRGGDRLEAGPVARRIAAELAGDRHFDRWREGVLDRRAYAQRLDAILDLPETVALNENKLALSVRIHWWAEEIVRKALQDAVAREILADARYAVDAYRCLGEWMHV